MRDAVISFPMLGDFSINPPSYFTVFGKNIYFYGCIIALGMILAALYCAKRAPNYGITEDDFYGALIWILPLAIVGARAYYVLFRLDYFAANPGEIFAIRNGGLAIYGGIIAGIITALVYFKVKKIKFFAAADLFSFGLLIGQAVGRWGNFMNREAFGSETDIFCRMGLTSPGTDTIYVHPTFLYESAWNLLGLILLILFVKRIGRKYDGQVFAFYVLWYGTGRAWIEGLRADSLYIGSSNIRVSQLLAIISAIAALIVLIINARKNHSPEALFVNFKSEADSAENEDQPERS